MSELSNQKDSGNSPNHVIDMLIDSTLKQHGARLEPGKIERNEKEQLKNLVNNLKENVEVLEKTKQEKEDQ